MKTYIVKSGDSVSKIARDQLGDINLWPALAAANGISSPYIIMPGQELSLELTPVEENSTEEVKKVITDDGKRKLIILTSIILAVIITAIIVVKSRKKK